MNYIKIYGERNTNTNYLSKLIELNLHAIEVSGVSPKYIRLLQKILPGEDYLIDYYFKKNIKKNLGWKHMNAENIDELKKYYYDDKNLSIITLTKNPYSWLLSLYKKPYHNKNVRNLSFIDFLKTPWKTVNRDNLSTKVNNPIELWNLKNRSYTNLKNVLQINTEMLFEDPKNIINKISANYNIKKKDSFFKDYNKSTKDKSKDSKFYKNYYLSEKWKELLDKEAIEIINKSLDEKLMIFFNYEFISK